MYNTHYFPGQQSDEIILYEVRPHHYALYLRLLGLVIISAVIFVLAVLLSEAFQLILLIGVLLVGLILVIGGLVVVSQHKQTVAYLTDRRLVRFEAHNPLHTATRSLSWDDTMKVKTYPPNFLWAMLNIGTLVLHARSSIVSFSKDDIQKEISGDDLELNNVWFYKDLGNYIDKLLYTNKHSQKELKSFRAFIPKPRGKRY